MLVRLLYASRVAPSSSAEALAAILRSSRANNAKAGVTGVLCCSESIFMQSLEGGRTVVSQLFQKIAADARHKDVVLLSYEEIAERRFAGWAMGQVNVSRLNPSLMLKYSETAELDPYAVSGKASMALFDDLVATASVMCSN